MQPQLVQVSKMTENMSVAQIAADYPPWGWEEVFDAAKNEIRLASEQLENHEKAEGPYFPLKKNIFNAFHKTPLHSVRVVIVGQDPYPEYTYLGVPRAQGLAFSVSRDDTIPHSLKNIFNELRLEYPDYPSTYHGCLESWAYQGVLLLNTCLTVDPNKPKSHGSIWSGFIDKVIRAIISRPHNSKIIFLLWGTEAQNAIMPLLDNKCIVLTAGHPSSKNKTNPFVGCGHFKKVNEFLEAGGETPIRWQLSE